MSYLKTLIKCNNTIKIAIFILAVLNSSLLFGVDPNDKNNSENIDSLLAANVINASAEAQLNKKMKEFYQSVNEPRSENRFKLNVKSSRNEYRLFDNFAQGEIAVPESKSNRRMWGEVDHKFELKEQISNYKELLKAYSKQKSWARKNNYDQIVTLMDEKIDITKDLIRDCKKNLRKY